MSWRRDPGGTEDRKKKGSVRRSMYLVHTALDTALDVRYQTSANYFNTLFTLSPDVSSKLEL